jgi:hypothetical protein
VPVAVGFLIAWGLLPATLSDQAVAAFSALLTAAYYLIVRLLESRWPALGWLLGAPKTPTYPGSSG